MADLLTLYQVHVYKRGEHSGMSSWQALRPERKPNQPVGKPFLFLEEEARMKIDRLAASGIDRKNLRMIKA